MTNMHAVSELKYLVGLYQRAQPMFESFHGHLSQRSEPNPIPWVVSELPKNSATFTVNFLSKTVLVVLSATLARRQPFIQFFELDETDPKTKLPLGELHFAEVETGMLAEERYGKGGSTSFPSIADPEEALLQMANVLLKTLDGSTTS